jgi:hypothetical protein
MSRLRPHLTYANVMSTLCLFALLGGGAYAATKLKRNSVGSAQIKKGAVKGVDVKDDGLSGKDIVEASLGTVPNAEAVDGIDSKGLVRSFGGNINDTEPDLVFAVPELDAQILGDTSPASASCFRIRNTGATGGIAVSDFSDQTTSLFGVAPGATSPDSCADGPLLLTNTANPDQMLMFGCAETGRAYCFGQLMEAPTR